MKLVRVGVGQPCALPLMNDSVPAGFPSPATDHVEDRIDLNDLIIKHPSATFFIRVEGDSMKDAFIPEHALLVIDRSIKPVSNNIVLAVIGDEFTVKRYVVNSKGTFLYPANKKYKALQITEEMNMKVWGVVTHIIIDTKVLHDDRDY
ncbi:MAG: translesion error-prone DNA polymerase V autoproteolytic subunit [Bacteroidota bacterium]